MADIQISYTHESELAAYMASGNYGKAVEILSTHPEAFTTFITLTGKGIAKSKNEAQKVMDRNFIQKLLSSNTSDLAKIIMGQNETMGYFFVMLQLLTLSAKGNSKLLTDLCMSVRRTVNIGDKEQENLSQMAIDFLEHNIESIKEAEIRDKALKKLLKAAEITDQFEMRIAAMVDEVEQKNESFKNDVKENLGKYKAETEEQLLDIIQDIGSFKESIRKDLGDLNKSLTTDLSANSDRISAFESLTSQMRDELNGEIHDIKATMHNNEQNTDKLIAKLNMRVLISSCVAVAAIMVAVIGFVL